MGLIPDQAKKLWSGYHLIKNGFPIASPSDAQIYENQIYTIYNTIKNVSLLSRYKNGGNTQIGIMRNLYYNLERIHRESRDCKTKEPKKPLLPDMFTVIYLK